MYVAAFFMHVHFVGVVIFLPKRAFKQTEFFSTDHTVWLLGPFDTPKMLVCPSFAGSTPVSFGEKGCSFFQFWSHHPRCIDFAIFQITLRDSLRWALLPIWGDYLLRWLTPSLTVERHDLVSWYYRLQSQNVRDLTAPCFRDFLPIFLEDLLTKILFWRMKVLASLHDCMEPPKWRLADKQTWWHER